MATLDDLLIGVGVSGMRDMRSDFDRVARMADDAVDTTESLFDRMSLRADTSGVRSDFDDVGDWARRAVGDTESVFDRLRPSFPGVKSGADDAVGGATSIFKGMGGPLAFAAGAAGGLAGAALVGEFLDAVDDAKLEDTLAARLDLTARDAEKYGDLTADLYAGAWGDSMEDVTNAIDAVDSTLGDLSIDELEDLTVHALDLAAAFDSDVDEAVNAAGVLMKTGLADDGEDAFDLIVKAMQSVPRLMRDELLPIIEEYSQDLAGLGINGEDAMGLLVGAAQLGRIELDKTGDSMKELVLLASDMSDATQDAYQRIGLDAETMARKLVTGGTEARSAFDQIIDGLLDIEDPLEQANTAIALFGTPLEDLNKTEIPAFLQSMDQMTGKFGDAEGAADRMGTTLNDNVATDIESFKRRAGTAVDNWVEENVLPNASKVIDAFEENGVGGALDTAIDLWEDAQPRVQAWWDGTFVPWFEDVAIPGMLELGKLAGQAFVDGLNDIDLFPDPDTWIRERLPDWMPGSMAPSDHDIDMRPVPPRTSEPDPVYNPDPSGLGYDRNLRSAAGNQSITVNNYYPVPASADSTSESYRRAAMELV